MKRSLSFLLFIILPAASEATLLYLAGPAEVATGAAFEVDLFGDFEGFGVTGGAIEIVYDAALAEVTEFVFAVPHHPDLACPGAAWCPVNPPGSYLIALASFPDPMIPRDAGLTRLGTFSMIAGNTAGIASLEIVHSPLAGGWFDAEFRPMPTPTLNGASISIVAVAVDGPATALLLFIGFVAFHYAYRAPRVAPAICGGFAMTTG